MRLTGAIVLAGGQGTRLRGLVADRPKVMAEVNGRPVLSYQLDYLQSMGMEYVVLSVGYLREMISDYYGDAHAGLKLIYAPEESPLGTGGAIKNAFRFIEGDWSFVLNGDTFFAPDLEAMCGQHFMHQADVSIAVTHVDNASRYGSVGFGADSFITRFEEKTEQAQPGWINAGIYLMGRSTLEAVPSESFSVENDIFRKGLARNKMLAYVSTAPFLDMGIPDDYHRAPEFVKTYFSR